MAVSIEKLLEKNVIFSDSAANNKDKPNFYENPIMFDKLNWDLINSNSCARLDDNSKHLKMAEVLVYKHVPIDWIESYIVWNKTTKEIISECYKRKNMDTPTISFEPFKSRYHYIELKSAKSGKNLFDAYSTLPYSLMSKAFYFPPRLRRFIDHNAIHGCTPLPMDITLSY